MEKHLTSPVANYVIKSCGNKCQGAGLVSFVSWDTFMNLMICSMNYVVCVCKKINHFRIVLFTLNFMFKKLH